MFRIFDGSYQVPKLIFIVVVAALTVVSFIAINRQDSPQELKSIKAEMASLKTVGGLGEIKETNPEVEAIVDKIRPELEQKSGIKYESLKVLSYKSQVVAGSNYFVKALAKTVGGAESIIHLRIYQDLSRNLELTAHKLDQPREAELTYFQ